MIAHVPSRHSETLSVTPNTGRRKIVAKENFDDLVQRENFLCKSWPEFTDWLSKIPELKIECDYEKGALITSTWIFRGHQDSDYKLEPTIEREAKGKNLDWPILEKFVSFEFKARDQGSTQVGSYATDPLMWLAEMQHYGIPTRLLDFTFSPFVALYFSIRNHQETQPNIDWTRLTAIEKEQLASLLKKAQKPKHVRIWAIDASVVNNRCKRVTSEAEMKAQGQAKPPFSNSLNSLHPDYFSGQEDMMISGLQDFSPLINNLLTAKQDKKQDDRKYRGELRRRGCICAALPPVFNQRLAIQQGLFMVNLADTSFWESLGKMMDKPSGWLRTCDIPVHLIPEFEERLLQMNIHEQSIFPDREGLAGLIRQKIRLQKFHLLKIE